jgi:hypothetical protein
MGYNESDLFYYKVNGMSYIQWNISWESKNTMAVVVVKLVDVSLSVLCFFMGKSKDLLAIFSANKSDTQLESIPVIRSCRVLNAKLSSFEW